MINEQLDFELRHYGELIEAKDGMTVDGYSTLRIFKYKGKAYRHFTVQGEVISIVEIAMKKFIVTVDSTFLVTVRASNHQEALKKALSKFQDDPDLEFPETFSEIKIKFVGD